MQLRKQAMGLLCQSIALLLGLACQGEMLRDFGAPGLRWENVNARTGRKQPQGPQLRFNGEL
jgi:hypothetical protein